MLEREEGLEMDRAGGVMGVGGCVGRGVERRERRG